MPIFWSGLVESSVWRFPNIKIKMKGKNFTTRLIKFYRKKGLVIFIFTISICGFLSISISLYLFGGFNNNLFLNITRWVFALLFYLAIINKSFEIFKI